MLATIWLTDNCNLSCSYCYEKNKGSRFMDRLTGRMAADFLVSHAISNDIPDININFYGGEPLLNFSVMQYIASYIKDKCKAHGLRVGFMFTTNGTILNDDITEFIERFRVSISISIDGPKAIHDKNRKHIDGRGSFDKAHRAGKRLQILPISLIARLTFDAGTVGNLARSIEFLADQGYMVIKPVPNFFAEGWNESSLSQFQEQLLDIVNLEKKYPKTDITILKPYLKRRKVSPCQGAGIHELNIMTDGNLYPCTVVAGNSRFNVGDINNGIDWITLRNQHSANAAIARESCRGCNYFDFCLSARCTYVNYSMTGDLSMTNRAYCRINRILFAFTEQALGKYVAI